MNSEWKLTARMEYLPRVNYALVHNGVKCLDYCELESRCDDDLNEVRVVIEGDCLKRSEVGIGTIPHGAVVRVSGIEIVPDADGMLQLTESRTTEFTLTVMAGGEEVLCERHDMVMMPYDQWAGTAVIPSVLAAFVTPNAAAISTLNIEAARRLQEMTGSSALDEYQTRDPNRVRAMVAAVYRTVQAQGIVYCAPPASFEGEGQRIRMAEKLLDEKLGTCMDTTLLMASCLEAMGVNPLLVMLEGHIFVGAWLVDKFYGHAIGDDGTYLLKSSADGINEVVLVETTCVTSDVRFEDAVEQAERHLRGSENSFICFLDVKRCRMEGIRPLPARILQDGVWHVENDGLEHRVGHESIVEKQQIEVNVDEELKLTKQQLWERKLLDISLRNNLTNMRVGRRALPFISFEIDHLEDHLQAGEDYTVLPKPDSVGVQAGESGIFDSATYRRQFEKLVVEGLNHHQLYSYFTPAELQASLKFLYRTSRTLLEENGANSLFLTLGLLKWYETEKSVRPRYAPILLLPVDIIRRSGDNYIIRTREEEIILNVTLVEMLKQQFRIHLTGLDPLPTDASGVDVKTILTIVRTHLRDLARWDVIEEAMLGIFSFNKFVMWNDIHNNAEHLRNHPVVQSLMEQRIKWSDESPAADAREIDRQDQPATFAVPLDVDSSQLEAIVESGQGKSFILHGPPGTGKSQTITNMIANALYHGKRVLFVAEKMAALSVVQKRLKKIGLEPFCLEMHSNKATKTHFLNQLDMALNVTHIKPSEEYAKVSQELFDQRQELIAYMEALHRKHSSGLSLYDSITGFLAFEGDEIQLPLERLKTVKGELIGKRAEDIAALDTVFQISGHPSTHPLRELDIYDASMEATDRLRKNLEALEPVVAEAQRYSSFFVDDSWKEHADLLRKADQLGADITERYSADILSEDVGELKNRYQEAVQKWFLPRFFAKRSLMKYLRRFRDGMQEEDIMPLFGQMEQRKSLLDQCKPALAPYGAEQEKVASLAKRALGMIEQFGEGVHFDSSNLPSLSSKLPQWLAHLDKARQWSQWSQRKLQLEQAQLQPVVKYLEKNGKSGKEAANALQKGVYHQLALLNIDSDKALQMFNGLIFEDIIDKYRQLASKFQQLTTKELYCRLAANIPNLTVAAANTSEVGILKRNIKNGGRGTSIRQIIDQIPTLLPKLCPCMLMSPISVAQYIDLANDKFDLVIFDEASQMPTSEAVGAIARGKALVVVGDPMQMPPTSFFKTAATDEEEADIDDMESILDDCITLSIPSRYLSWHYRSKHESLITFSNSQYYDSRLTTFPSVDDRVSKVQLVHVDGVYDKSHSRCNKAEAEAIVNEIVRRLSNEQLSKRSIGVVSFSQVQQNMIEDMLIETLAKQPALEEKAFHSEEPIFIKNLENVQGDERDVILFSVGYGPDKNGQVTMNFGPLNNAGGERRLNVAVSRARYEMMIFSTLRPEQIDLNRSKARGVEGLKRFLEFARDGRMAVDASQTAFDNQHSSLIAQLADELGQRGYKVDTNIGRSHFKIDVAVIDPTDEGRYLLGIICDGKSYYDTKTVRDREIVQPTVLNMLEWNVMRLWSVDWFENKQGVIDRIVAKLDQLKSAKPEEKTPEPLNIAPMKLFDIEGAAVEDPVAGRSSAYKSASLSAPAHAGDLDYLVAHPAQVRAQVEKMIAVEQPITFGLICKQVARLWGLARVTPRLQSTVRSVLSSAYLDPLQRSENPYYWKSAADAADYRMYRTDSGRDINDIPIIEVMNAVVFAVEQQVSVPVEDLKRQTAQMLGFARRGPKVEAGVASAIGMLLRQGKLQASEGNISIKA